MSSLFPYALVIEHPAYSRVLLGIGHTHMKETVPDLEKLVVQ